MGREARVGLPIMPPLRPIPPGEWTRIMRDVTEGVQRTLSAGLTPGGIGGKLTTSPTTTPRSYAMASNLERTMLEIIDVIADHGGTYRSDTYGATLRELASLVHGEEVPVGDKRYHATSLAVLRLEEIGFVSVDRAYHDEAARANVILSVSVL